MLPCLQQTQACSPFGNIVALPFGQLVLRRSSLGVSLNQEWGACRLLADTKLLHSNKTSRHELYLSSESAPEDPCSAMPWSLSPQAGGRGGGGDGCRKGAVQRRCCRWVTAGLLVAKWLTLKQARSLSVVLHNLTHLQEPIPAAQARSIKPTANCTTADKPVRCIKQLNVLQHLIILRGLALSSTLLGMGLLT